MTVRVVSGQMVATGKVRLTLTVLDDSSNPTAIQHTVVVDTSDGLVVGNDYVMTIDFTPPSP